MVHLSARSSPKNVVGPLEDLPVLNEEQARVHSDDARLSSGARQHVVALVDDDWPQRNRAQDTEADLKVCDLCPR